MPRPDRISVVSVSGEEAWPLSGPARRAVEGAATLVGSGRQLALALDAVDRAREARVRTVETTGDISAVLDAVDKSSGSACVLASGDPGFFGIVRPLAQRFGADRLEVHPGPSAVSLAFARLGLPWDDAVVVSAHGRPLGPAVEAASSHHKVAVLVSPDQPPEELGRELLRSGAARWDPPLSIAVCANLGLPDEAVSRTDVHGLAHGCWEPLSVVVALRGEHVRRHPSTGWGLPNELFAHRMITTAEVRAIVLGKLSLPTSGVVWDVGAGSGSVAIECARLRPGIRVLAVERGADEARSARANARDHDVRVEVVEGEAPQVLEGMPDPDRVFVGGGGSPVLHAALARLREGGRIVATYAAIDRASEAFRCLGSMVEVSVSRAGVLPDGGTRLRAENPVFVAWGPEAAPA